MELTKAAFLIIPLLQGFEWFDEGLQRSLRARGWPVLTRPESMVMIHVLLGMTRPPEIASSLGLTRQAIYRTLGQICAKGLFELQPDPEDRRGSIIQLTDIGNAMRRDAQHIVTLMHRELQHRLGEKLLAQLAESMAADWGPAPAFGPNDRRLR